MTHFIFLLDMQLAIFNWDQLIIGDGITGAIISRAGILNNILTCINSYLYKAVNSTSLFLILILGIERYFF